MKCPFCGHLDTRVLDTRLHREGELTKRRRECVSCHARFTTQESHLRYNPFIKKKDGRREPFRREKIFKSIQVACHKRSVSIEEIESIVERVTQLVLNKAEREISSTLIGQAVMAELRARDDIAYVRFASVYKTFRDAKEFVTTVETLAQNQGVSAEQEELLKMQSQLTGASPDIS